MNTINSETQASYTAEQVSTDTENAIIERAKQIINARMFCRLSKDAITSPAIAEDFFKIHFGEYEREVFGVLFLDTAHKPIAFEELFYGTLSSASVYPREVIKAVIKHNAAAVMIVHNHPSGNPEPSHSDEVITKRLDKALETIDVKLLDHFIIGEEVTSFAKIGLI